MENLRIETVSVDSLQFDPQNARKHSEKNLDAIAGSLKLFGQRKPIIVTPDNFVVAGNGTLQAAKNLGWTEIAITRTPRGWTWDQIKAYALADNRTAELAEWDSQILAEQLLELDANGWELQDFGFVSLEPPTGLDDKSEDNPYNQNVNVPQYEIVGEKPQMYELVDDSKTVSLQNEIDNLDIPNDVKKFLKIAAHRHTVFNYRKIAEYYAHMPKEVQELFEKSALVIIDLHSAIANGYTNFHNAITELESVDRYEP